MGKTEKQREYQRQWRAKNREKLSEHRRRYRIKNRDKVRAGIKRWRDNNPERMREYSRRWTSENPDKVQAAQHRYNATHPEKQRDWHLKRTYSGKSISQYEADLKAQGGVCAICRMPPGEDGKIGNRYLHYDHDHRCCPGKRSCGKCIRGLLCHICNRVLGFLKDDPEILKEAITYLESHQKRGL